MAMTPLANNIANATVQTPQTTDEQFFGHEHLTVIEPPKGWHMLNWRELWAYRELLWVLTMRDIKVRYKQTVLGAGWAIIRPVMTMVIFSVVFGQLAKMPSDGLPYPIFVYAGLLPWTFFSASIGASGQSLRRCCSTPPRRSPEYGQRRLSPPRWSARVRTPRRPRRSPSASSDGTPPDRLWPPRPAHR